MNDMIETKESTLSRRGFLSFALATTALGILPRRTFASMSDFFTYPERRLSLYNIHTGESFESVYWIEGEYNSSALQDLNFIMRDYRTGSIHDIDSGLFDTLYLLSKRLDASGPFHLISGYRSKKTNQSLSRRSRRVARNSLHLQGMAADINLPGYSLAILKRAAIDLYAGGVGYYPRSNFIHIDTGRIRYW